MKISQQEQAGRGMGRRSVFYSKITKFPKSRAGENAWKQEKTTDIWFDKKTPTIYICTHNTDLKNRLTAYAEQYPDQCKLTEDDVVIGCKSFEIAKGRLSFRLTAPYSEERRRAASIFAKANNSFLEK